MTTPDNQVPWPPAVTYPKKKRHVGLWIVVGVVALCGIGSFLGLMTAVSGASHGTLEKANPVFVVPSTTPREGINGSPCSGGCPTDTPPSPSSSPAPIKSASLTGEQQNAVGTATDYLDVNEHFSRKGLIGQLKFEGYSTKDATLAVDSIHVDWNAQAAGDAKDYLATQHFSKSGLRGQLEYEGFTKAQAEYGVAHSGL